MKSSGLSRVPPSHGPTTLPTLTPPSPPGAQLDLPSLVTPSQLETLLNGLLSNEEKLPYAFHIEDQVCGWLDGWVLFR